MSQYQCDFLFSVAVSLVVGGCLFMILTGFFGDDSDDPKIQI